MKGKKELELDFGDLGELAGGNDRPPDARRDHGGDKALPGQAVNRCKSVRASKVLDPEPDRELDWALVSSIVESARTIGLLHPIAVRKLEIEKKGEIRTRTVLVAGAHRLAAARRLGYERIDCIYVDYDDDASVQLVQIGEDLFRKHLTVLRHAELLTKWYELASKDFVYGQVDRKHRRGRPPTGTSRMLRDMPPGLSLEAWRMKLRRAKRIARIEPEAKQAAIDAGLDDNQDALLAIAAANGRKAQLRKVAKLAPPLGGGHHTPAKPAVGGNAARTETPDSEQADSEKLDSVTPDKDQERDAKPGQPETSLGQLEGLWNKHLRKLWKHTPFCERERFIAMLRRTRNRTGTDAVQLVKEAFQGREKIYAKDLYGFAKGRCVSKEAVRRTLKGLGYRRKREYGTTGPYYYLNTTLYWKGELEAISEAELTGRGMQGSQHLT
jgi:ParB-like chromosome segregation protein Spo0J